MDFLGSIREIPTKVFSMHRGHRNKEDSHAGDATHPEEKKAEIDHEQQRSSPGKSGINNRFDNLRIKLDAALTRVRKTNSRAAIDADVNEGFSKYFRSKGTDLLSVDLLSWETFYARCIAKVSGLIANEPCENSECIVREEDGKPKSVDFAITFDGDLRSHTFVPPRSPHNLIEETFYNDPWALLVATIFLNKTSCMNARPYIVEFLKKYPDAEAVVRVVDPRALEVYFDALGLMRKRARQVWRMSRDYLLKDWRDVDELYGIGKYGADAYNMFCRGDFSVEPTDRFLRIYKAWYLMEFKKCGR